MEIQEFIEKFADALDIMSKDDITADTILEAIEGWSSLSFVQTVVFFDEEFEKDITIELIKKCKTINDLFQLSK